MRRRGSWWADCDICPPQRDGTPVQHYTQRPSPAVETKHRRILAARERAKALEAVWGHLRARREPAPPLGPTRVENGLEVAHPLAQGRVLYEAAARLASDGNFARAAAAAEVARATVNDWLRAQLPGDSVLSDLDAGFGLTEFERFWQEAGHGDG